MSGDSETPPLLFEWQRPAQFRWKFFGLILLSAVAHVATFFLFQIAYPPRVTIPPPAPEVSLLLPTTPENRALLRRIEAEDPALIASSSGVEPPNLLKPIYRASFATIRTQPRTVPAENTVVRYPSPKDPLAIIRSRAQPAQLADVAPPPIPTRIAFSESLASQVKESASTWQFSPRASTPLEPAAFLLGVSARGEVRYVFQQRSSGDSAIDDQAAAQLPRIVFSPAEAAMTWGIATITWGDDAYGEPAKQPAPATGE